MAFLLVGAALGHNGVVHLPGEASSIGVSAAFVPGCADCITIYNYGQNYVRLHSVNGSYSEPLRWPYAYLPVAATVVGIDRVLALVDSSGGNTFVLVEGDTETPLTDGCFDAEDMAVFVDPVVPGTPTALALQDGSVYTIDVEHARCAQWAAYPAPLTGSALMGDGATFYGYAEASGLRCWFLGVNTTGAVLECYAANGTRVFQSAPLNDGRQSATFLKNNYHTGGDIFFADGCLYVANGETNPSNSLLDSRIQFPDHACGKLIRYCGISADGGAVERTVVGVGLRHPWTSVGLSNNRRVIGDVGGQTCEEASLVHLDTLSAAHVANFGWPKFEGNVLRSAVAPYNTATFDATLVFTDSNRAESLRSYTFAVYVALFVSLGVALGALCCREETEPYQTLALTAVLAVGLPQMAAAPGYVGNDNGVYATHLRYMVATEESFNFAEWYVMLVFFVVAFLCLELGAVCASRLAVGAGGAFALVYLITFMALLSAPAVITPLPVVAFLVLAALFYTLTPESEPSEYASLD